MRNWIKNSCYVVLGLIGFNSTHAEAAVDLSLCIDGIAGDVDVSKNDNGCIDVLAWSWGASTSGTVAQPGKANFQDLGITKYQDVISTYLLQSVANGKATPKLELRVRNACAEQGCTGPMTFKLTAPQMSIVTSYSNGGSDGDDRLTENVSFNMSAYAWCNYELDLNGAVTDSACGSWDSETNAPIP
jgi:type VI secretion system secreted protein Hcp